MSVSVWAGNSATAIQKNNFKGIDTYTALQIGPWASWARAKGLLHLVLLNQVHGAQIVTITEYDALEGYATQVQEGDALITCVPGIALAIATADCVPVLLHDPVTQTIAAVHAGWRGILAELIPATIASMRTQAGVDPYDVWLYVGASARACCYSLDSASVEILRTQVEKNGEKVPDSILQEKYDHCGSKSYTVDVPLLALCQAERAGVSRLQMRIVEPGIDNEVHVYDDLSRLSCTICTNLYCSYRRNRLSDERQLWMIALAV